MEAYEGGGGRVGASTHQGADSVDVGLIDELLRLFQQQHGRPFSGQVRGCREGKG